MGEPQIFRPERAEIGPYKLTVTLGTGSTGKVKLGLHKETGIKVAVKIIDKANFVGKPSMQTKIHREIAVMKLIEHPHIIGLYEVYETQEHLYLIIEHIEGGELFDYLVSKGRLVPAEALHFFQQIISGVHYCHTHLICHRDLKPENLLLDLDRNIKIGDFGMSALMKPGTAEMLQTSCGSPHYACPEVVSASEYDGRAADVWSCGVILYALVVGKLPFDDDNIRRLLTKVKSGLYTIPSFVPTQIKELIHRMLTVNPDDRITMQEIIDMSWFNSRPIKLLPRDESHMFELAYRPLTLEEIDKDILNFLFKLGWGSRNEIMNALMAKQENLEKVFYNMFVEREKNLGQLPEDFPSTLIQVLDKPIAKPAKPVEKEKAPEIKESVEIDAQQDIKTRRRRNTVAESVRPSFLEETKIAQRQMQAPEDVKEEKPGRKSEANPSVIHHNQPLKSELVQNGTGKDPMANGEAKATNPARERMKMRGRSISSVGADADSYSKPKLKSFRPRVRKRSIDHGKEESHKAPYVASPNKKNIWFSSVFGNHEKNIRKKQETSSLIYTDVQLDEVIFIIKSLFEDIKVSHKMAGSSLFKAKYKDAKSKDACKFSVDVVAVTGGTTIFINFTRTKGSSSAYRTVIKRIQKHLNNIFQK